MSSLRDEQGRQPTLDKETAEQRKEVKLPGTEQRAELSPAQDRGKSNVELWEQVMERENQTQAKKRVERNRGAPGIDGMNLTLKSGHIVKQIDDIFPQTHWEI
ncbi:MAG: hypothetical protein JEZ06_23755, partial [Anaerolineaceae bacterium]|nr:hypothetical protein [Anaerolineaceae bacterium]